MTQVQVYLQDLLTIDCDIQNNLQNLILVSTREALESKSNEIKHGLRDFKDKLNEMKEFCDIYSKNDNQRTDILINELQIQKEHLLTVESRFRNAYLAAQVKLDQIEREDLMNSKDKNIDLESITAKKRSINNQLILKKTSEITSKLTDINRQLKWTENQTSDIIPVLDESSKVLRNTQQEFGFMKVVLVDGKRLLVRLSRREFTDKLLIILCLCFFFSVIFYIVWKRLFRL